MKEIKAVLRPSRLPVLRDRLRATPGFPGMTVTKVEGCSAPSLHAAASLKEDLTDFTPKVRIEIVAPDEVVETLVDLIIQIGQTGQVGDGLVWVTDIQRAAFLYKTTSLGSGREGFR